VDPTFVDTLIVGEEYAVDGGPIYTETKVGLAFGWQIIEPCNASSAFLFVLIVAYWAYVWFKNKTRFQDQPFLAIALPVLLVGGIGGTLFHGLRMYRAFLVMDWMPIMLLSLGASMYFFTKVLKRWWYAVGVIVGAFFLSSFLFRVLFLEWGAVSRTAAISINYSMMATLILLPVFLWLRKTGYRHGYLILLALLSFIVAVSFRYTDSIQPPLLSLGTHWLWHLFGATACFLMTQYIWLTDQQGSK
jgi:hypothetical protein